MDRVKAAMQNIEQVEKWLRGKLRIYRDTAVSEQYGAAIIALRDARDTLATERRVRRLKEEQ